MPYNPDGTYEPPVVNPLSGAIPAQFEDAATAPGSDTSGTSTPSNALLGGTVSGFTLPPVSGTVNKRTGMLYGERAFNPLATKTKAAKPGYATASNTPDLAEYITNFASKQDGLKPEDFNDPDKVPDSKLLEYAGKYASSFGVQSLMASGQKVDKQFLSTFVPNMQYYVSQNLPELRSKIAGTASKT
ncbi:MAG: hypothetical protein ACREQ5_04320, partial [Candidatus Dormibacteria bacterium]